MLPSIVGYLGGGAPVSTNSYESIQTVTVGSGGASSILLSSIPNTYTHLQIRAINQTNRTTIPRDSIKITFNGDSSSSYNSHALYGDGATAGAYANGTSAFMEAGFTATSSAGANIFGVQIIDILDYTNTNKNKTLRSLGGADCNGTVATYGCIVGLESGLYFANTNAINTVTITPYSGSLFSQFSSFALYGVK